MNNDEGVLINTENTDGLAEEHWQFDDDEEYIIYKRLYSEGKKVVREDPLEYRALCELGQELAREGKLDEASQAFNRALDLNPIASVALRGYADCHTRMGMPDIGEKALRLMGRHIVDEAVLWIYYLDWSNVELYYGNVLAAAACMYYATNFNQRGGHVGKTVDVDNELQKFAMANNIDLEYVKANVMPILAKANVPIYSFVDILRRDIDLGIMTSYYRDAYVAIIDGETGEVITDREAFDNYSDDDLIAGEFFNLAEAKAFSAIDAPGKNIAVVKPTEYIMMLEEAAEYFRHRQYEQAADILKDSFYLNPVGLDAAQGLAICLFNMGEYNNAEKVLRRVVPYITFAEYAQKFYELFAQLEYKRGAYNNMAACAHMALKFGDSSQARSLLDTAQKEAGAFNATMGNPEEVLLAAGIPVIKKYEIGNMK